MYHLIHVKKKHTLYARRSIRIIDYCSKWIIFWKAYFAAVEFLQHAVFTILLKNTFLCIWGSPSLAHAIKGKGKHVKSKILSTKGAVNLGVWGKGSRLFGSTFWREFCHLPLQFHCWSTSFSIFNIFPNCNTMFAFWITLLSSVQIHPQPLPWGNVYHMETSAHVFAGY